MTNLYRALCAEVLTLLDLYEDGDPYVDWDVWKARARALLAEPEAEGPSADEWDALVAHAWDQYETVGYQGERFMYDSDFSNALDYVRRELARWGRPAAAPVPKPGEVESLQWPEGWSRRQRATETQRLCVAAGLSLGSQEVQRMLRDARDGMPLRDIHDLIAHPAAPPAPEPGEVGELVAALGSQDRWTRLTDAQLDRAATLLQQQAAPVPVSERLPGPEDCDEQGRCWMFGKIEGDWRLISTINPGIPKLKYCFSHWLPANALPTPEAQP